MAIDPAGINMIPFGLSLSKPALRRNSSARSRVSATASQAIKTVDHKSPLNGGRQATLQGEQPANFGQMRLGHGEIEQMRVVTQPVPA